MPFGISVAPEEFECKLQERLADIPGVVVVRDDILVMGYGDSVTISFRPKTGKLNLRGRNNNNWGK